MKTFGRFDVGLIDGSPELVHFLLEAYPDGRRITQPAVGGSRRPPQEYFRCKLPHDDPKLDKLIQVLIDHGYRLWNGRSAKKDKDVLFHYERVYDTSDFEIAELLQPQPETYVGTVDRNSDGLLLLDPESDRVKKTLDGLTGFEIGFTVTMNLIVSDALRAKLEASDMKRLLFKPILSAHNPALGATPGYWELTSDYVMPPLANPELLDGFHNPDEYHYRASDLKAAAPFDFGRCLEYRDPIVSQKFYRFCVEHKLNMTWEPVRIDPD